MGTVISVYLIVACLALVPRVFKASVKKIPTVLAFVLFIPLIPFSGFIQAHRVYRETPGTAKLLIFLNGFILLVFIGIVLFFNNI